MWPRTIRARTTLVATALAGTTLVVGAWLLLAAVDASLTESRDQTARAELRALAERVAAGDSEDPIPVGEDEMAQVVDAGGRVLQRSVNLGDSPAVTPLAPPPGEMAVTVRAGVPDDEDLETFRIWATTAATDDGPVRVYVGSSPERVREAVLAARNALLVGVPAVTAALAVLTWWSVGRALAPVDRVRSEVATITTTDLERRVPVPASGDEISRLATTMNAMLSRLEAGSAREREFVADASHELLSPLAALRAQLEVAAADPAGTDQARLVADLRSDVTRMELLVRDLLALARSDTRHDPASLPLVDLDDLVLAEVRRVARPAGVVVDASRVSAAPVRGRPDELGRLVRNLLENAVAHAGQRVDVMLATVDGRVELVVADDGPGVAPDLRDHVFDRFVTGSASRRPGRGTGLGLAIARATAVAHGGSLSLDGAPAEHGGEHAGEPGPQHAGGHGDGHAGAVFRLRLAAA